ncbi:MAG: CinA family nicotinamide mononucleotide deamidase-related protein [Chlamydiota bacterium]|nr:CinA family nicotinamide mononucleotide deamidase-related protein [Chlamydiota bacterium]
MNVEIIAIGSEILSGFTINTNAAFLSRELLKVGIPTKYHTILPDSADELTKGLKQSLEKNDIIITTGGLGPTCDDLTRPIVASMFDSDFVFDEEIAKELEKRYSGKLTSLRDQATVPRKAKVLKNPLGTAPGLLFESGTVKLFLLPGVPAEMKEIFFHSVLPIILETYPEEKRRASLSMHFVSLIESQVDPVLRNLKERYPEIDFGVYPYRGRISVSMSVSAELKKEGKKYLMEPYRELQSLYRDHFFESVSGHIEEAVHNLFIERKLTLSLAESCTGGTIASRLTAIPGASSYFLGSLVTYSNKMKEMLLGVSPETLETSGAVSKEVVSEMVGGLLKRTESDYGIAVSGVAGPSGGTDEKPVGTVWAAIQKRGKAPIVWMMQARGSREMVIDYTVNVALGKLYHLILEEG